MDDLLSEVQAGATSACFFPPPVGAAVDFPSPSSLTLYLDNGFPDSHPLLPTALLCSAQVHSGRGRPVETSGRDAESLGRC